jgi:hypothetical protein
MAGALDGRGEIEKVVTKFFLGNLSFRAGREDVESLILEAGLTCTSIHLVPRRDGDNRDILHAGFGFVGIEGASAERVIPLLDGRELHGRPIICSVARDREPADQQRPRR